MLSFRLTTLESVDSTNAQVKALIEAQEPEGCVVRAFEQTGGYGRQGRAWASPFGGMYQSILLRPQVALAQVPTITLVAGLAVRAALVGLCPDAESAAIQVKWPNDILCAQGKLCGISAEMHKGALCVGVGVNVFAPADDPCVTGGNTPAYFADLAGWDAADTRDQRAHINAVGDAILDQLARCYDEWNRCGIEAFLDEYRASMALLGSGVRMVDQAGGLIAQGTVTGVDEMGRLVLVTADGAVAISSGEAHIAKE